MANMGSILPADNKKVIPEHKNDFTEDCNCREDERCPLNGTCLIRNSVYEANISSNKVTM